MPLIRLENCDLGTTGIRILPTECSFHCPMLLTFCKIFNCYRDFQIALWMSFSSHRTPTTCVWDTERNTLFLITDAEHICSLIRDLKHHYPQNIHLKYKTKGNTSVPIFIKCLIHPLTLENSKNTMSKKDACYVFQLNNCLKQEKWWLI